MIVPNACCGERKAIVQRPPKPADAKRTASEVIELIKRLAADHTNTQIAEQLDTAGMRTSTGLPFDEKATGT